MFNETFKNVISREGVVSIVSYADGEAHVVNTWNSYIVLPDENRILIPAAWMNKTEEKITKNSNVLLTLGSREVQGKLGPGTGFLIKGTARFLRSGPDFDLMKSKYSFLTRVLEVTVSSIKQTI